MAKIGWDDRTNSGTDSEVSASIFNDTKTSVNTLYDIIEAQTGNTGSSSTGSQFISGTIYISSSIIPNTAPGETVSSFSLGRPNSAWSEIYVSDGSINFVSGSNISSFTKAELDSIKEGKSASTGSKGGIGSGSWITTQAIFSEGVNTSYFRLGSDRIYTSIGSNLLLDLTGSQVLIGLSGSSSTNTLHGNLHIPSGSIEVTGSIIVKSNSPAVISYGDVCVGTNDENSTGGGIQFFAASSNPVSEGQLRIYNYDNSVGFFTLTGFLSKISGSHATAQGYATTAGWYSHAEGYNTRAGALPYDIDEPGFDPIAGAQLGQFSHSEGLDTIAASKYSHAEGINTLTTGSEQGGFGNGAHAEGKNTIAAAEGAHSEGISTIAYGPTSHTEGISTITLGIASHAEGYGTIASGSAQHVQGKYNTHNNTTSLMIIGNGISDGARSDLALFNSNGIEFKNDLTASLISASGALYAAIPEDTNSSGINVVVYNPTTGQFEYTGSYSSGGSGGEDTDWHITDDNLNVTSSRNVVITGSLMQGDSTNNNQASNYSHAQGRETTATGLNSHAEGYFSIASAQFSHAEGGSSTATGAGSHAEGNTTISSGSYSHAEGRQTLSLGTESHTEGYFTTSSGAYSHAEGAYALASGMGSHAEGRSSTATGDGSHAEGNTTISSGSYSHAEGRQTLSLGTESHTEGYFTTSSGIYSHAEGASTLASGNASHAEGKNTIASGNTSHAEGDATIASGESSHAEGNNTLASGIGSHAEGQYTTSSGTYSHAEGQSTVSSGSYSHVEGYNNTAESQYSHVEGYNNSIIAFLDSEATHVEGQGNIIGIGNKFSHVEGQNNYLLNSAGSHIEGTFNRIENSNGAHVEGIYNTSSLSPYSHIEGTGNIASGSYQHIQGYYNTKEVVNEPDVLMVVGNGTDNNNRSDLFILRTTSATISGSVIIDLASLPQTNPTNPGQLYRDGGFLMISL